MNVFFHKRIFEFLAKYLTFCWKNVIMVQKKYSNEFFSLFLFEIKSSNFSKKSQQKLLKNALSSVGRTQVSKTWCRGFKSYRAWWKTSTFSILLFAYQASVQFFWRNESTDCFERGSSFLLFQHGVLIISNISFFETVFCIFHF